MQLTKNIIVVGDSFCMYPEAWPQQVADALKLKLINRGVGGEHWWNTHQFLSNLDDNIIKNTEVIIFCHTYAGRLPCDDPELGKFNLYNLDLTDEKQLAIKLYNQYIRSEKFLDWAQEAWFKNISSNYSCKMIHLHGFPWSLKFQGCLNGVSVIPNLSAISLNEIGAKDINELAGIDTRKNHFNDYNNNILAKQIIQIINNYQPGIQSLDVTQFEQKINSWFNWN